MQNIMYFMMTRKKEIKDIFVLVVVIIVTHFNFY